MNTEKPRPPSRKPGDDITDLNNGVGSTPGTDMQPEDAGTPESGNGSRGNAAESAMKQTSKTGQEEGSGR